jgi:hypothetical protein
MKQHIMQLKRLHACADAVAFAKDFPDLQSAWDACERGDWMLWLVGKTINCPPWSEGRKPLLACALDCAGTIEHLLRGPTKINIAVGVLRQWIAGDVDVEAAKQARHDLWNAAAYAAAADADADADAAAAEAEAADAAAADAAYAAADAAYAAAAYAAAAYAAAAYAAADAYAAAAAAAAYGAAAAYAAKQQKLKECADIVRRHYPQPSTL